MIKPAYVTGARPVVGTLGASGLMLLACSWFVLAPGHLSGTRDVGAPAPVRIEGGTHEPKRAHRSAATVPRTRRSAPRPVDAAHHPAASPSTAPHRTVTREPTPTTTQPASAPPPAVEPSPPPPAPEQPAVTSAPPAPVGDLPQVALPPVAIPSPPDVAAPDVDTPTLPLGLP